MSKILIDKSYFEGTDKPTESAEEALLVKNSKYEDDYSITFGGQRDGKPVFYYAKLSKELAARLAKSWVISKNKNEYVDLYSVRFVVNETKFDGTPWKNGEPHVYVVDASTERPLPDAKDAKDLPF